MRTVLMYRTMLPDVQRNFASKVQLHPSWAYSSIQMLSVKTCLNTGTFRKYVF